MFSRFFIDRPIFAAVISIVITLGGGIAMFTLPLAQYPPVAPPTIQVDCNYPGASAQVVAQTVAAPIEQKVNGVENMLYMSSQSTSDGSYTLTVTFKPGVNLNLCQVLVQNCVSLATPLLPDVVRQTGVITRKRSPDILLTVSLNSPDNRYDQLYLSNYAVMRVKDELRDSPVLARSWYSVNAITACAFGSIPTNWRCATWLSTTSSTRFANRTFSGLGASWPTPRREGPNEADSAEHSGAAFRTGRICADRHSHHSRRPDDPDSRCGLCKYELRSQDVSNRFDAKPTVGLAIFQLPDANALETADQIKAKMAELSKDFPAGVEYAVGYDTTPFIRESIEEVFKTLRDAVILVAIVVFVFLQGWRPAIIPLIAVPVAIVGTFSAMALAGFSLNNLTLFGLVLAIGIVVDDAIVVVEAVEQYIERGFPPHEAAVKAMEEVSSPIIAVGFVLSAVFVPCAFISGIVGQFFRQFALTIAISTIISTLNSLTLSPALAALLLRPKHGKRDLLTWLIDILLGWLFWLFNKGVQISTNWYVAIVGTTLRVPVLPLILYGGLLVLTYWGFQKLPTGFIPSQDKGYLVASIQLPDAASAERTGKVIAKIEAIALGTPGVKNVNSVAGNSFVLSAYGSNFGSMFIILKDFSERKDPSQSANSISAKIRQGCADEIPEALVNVFLPPAVSGLGRSGGYKIMVEDRGEMGMVALQEQTDNLVKKGNDTAGITGQMTVYKANSPQLFVDVNRDACLEQGVNLSDLFGTLQAFLGSRYVNDFNRFGRTWQVVVQADGQFRNDLDDVKRLMVRSKQGRMIPLGALCEVKPLSGPLVLSRYNMYPAAAINGAVANGYSTGQAIEALEKLARQELPQQMSTEWTEITYLERLSANTGMIVFWLSVVFVFLVLAALYESWTLPLAVILVVPMCILCSIAGVAYTKADINLFTQIGFVVLIGLACKNAILIVEFAKLRRDAGENSRTSTLDACRLRLRPILMTSFAFILGVVPLVYAKGAGAEMRQALGTAVFSGMLGVTLFGIFLTPVFYYVIDRMTHWKFFQSALFQKVAGIALDAIRLGPPRRALWETAKWLAKKAKRKPGRFAVAANAGPHKKKSVAAVVAGTKSPHDDEATFVATESIPPEQ